MAQNLTVRADFKNVGGHGTSANCVMNVFCVGTMVWENVYDDDGSFQPTSVSVQVFSMLRGWPCMVVRKCIMLRLPERTLSSPVGGGCEGAAAAHSHRR